MSLILIAESGTTKTDWRLVADRKVNLAFKTAGFNPFFVSPEFIRSELSAVIADYFNAIAIETVFFYGAGCSSDGRCNIIREGLISLFPNAEILIDTDLSAAAKALFPDDEGIAVILGTGSNSCYCKAGTITGRFNSLGYILGDEGSGNHMGRKLLKAYLQEELSPELHEMLSRELSMNTAEILDQLYMKPFPNRFLASFSQFIYNNIDNPFCKSIVSESLNEFFKNNLCRYPGFPDLIIRCTGGIANAFISELKQTAENYGAEINAVIASPVDELVNYHLYHRK
ncbi:MAG: ATPase [Bacteroidia bacterium]|nr:ATPase [Bacteroidia bacterium]